jgi:hypothetical protein
MEDMSTMNEAAARAKRKQIQMRPSYMYVR